VISLPKHAFAPYTQQRTGIVIFNKRKTPLSVADGDWGGLLRSLKNEKVGLYIVDNDGFANSDKRYPTELKDNRGRWKHNELADWSDNKGLTNCSILVEALINQKPPPFSTNEFGELTGQKFARVGFNVLSAKSDIKLLPDIYLRRNDVKSGFDEFITESQKILDFLTRKSGATPILNVKTRIKELLGTSVQYPDVVHTIKAPLKDLFKMQKGDQGFTEEIIYKFYDSEGIPVYGGGAEPPRFRVKKETKTKKNTPITIHSGPAILLSMDGSSGCMRVIPTGEFCSNHHGCVLYPFHTSINLNWIVQQCEGRLKQEASNQGGSATLTGTMLEELMVDVPIPAKLRDTVGQMRERLAAIYSELYEES
jgi:hypothetical protein